MSVKFKETVERSDTHYPDGLGAPRNGAEMRDSGYDRRDYSEQDFGRNDRFVERDAYRREDFRGRESGGRDSQERDFKERSFRERDFGGQEHDEKGRHDHHGFVHRFGEAVTKGEGAGGYLQAYLKQLESNPLRTKMLTSGTLSGLQEVLASWIAQDRNVHGHYFTSRVPKMAVYGAFISAPLGHLLIKVLQKTFAHRTSLKAKILQILVSNLIVAPIQNTVYLISMAIIAGARTFHQVRATIRAGFMPVMRVSWITSPIALAFAQQFLPQEAWVPFFNIVAFVIGTYINAHTKKKRLAALRRKASQEGREYYARSDSYSRRD